MFKISATLAATLLSFAASALEPVITIEGVSEYRLPNGLQVLLYPDSASATATVNIVYKVGSRHESYGETGMAHLLEHLMFKGTPRHPDFEKESAERGAFTNATTHFDRTNYFETFPATRENLKWALELEADRMRNAFIAQKDLDSEMTVVRNEFELDENDPMRVLAQRVRATAYLWHNYAHPTVGARSDIEGVPIGRLQAFYRTYYRPDNAALIVAGRFNEAEVLAYIDQVFGPILKPVEQIPTLYTAEPAQDGEREVILRRAGGEKSLIAFYHVPANAHPDMAALGLLVLMLNDQPSGRLYQEFVATKIATTAGSGVSGRYDPGNFTIQLKVPVEGNLVAARRTLDNLIAKLVAEPFTPQMLERVRTQQLNEFEQMANSPEQTAMALGENVAVGDWRFLFWDRDQMKKVTPQDVQRVAGTYLIPSNRTVGLFLPEEKPVRAAIPSAPNAVDLLKGYKGDASVQPGEYFEPTAANIEARTQRGHVGPIRTAFLPKKTRGSRVSGAIRLQFGEESALRNQKHAGRFVGGMLMRGTDKHTRAQLQDELTHLKATLNVHGGPTGVNASFETTRENLPQVLRLVAEILKTPAFPADQLEQMKREALASIANSRTEPGAIARNAAERYLSPYAPGDFRYEATFDEDVQGIERVSVEDLRIFHRRFYGIGTAQAAFVGNMDRREIEALLGRLFARWKSASPYRRVAQQLKSVDGNTVTLSTPDKANAVFILQANLALKDNDADYAPLFIGNSMLGGSFNSRLVNRIRQKDGLSYSVGSYVSADAWDAVGSFGISATAAPQNMSKLDAAVREELALALQAGFTLDELNRARSQILQSRLLERATDSSLAQELARHLYLNRTFEWDAAFEKSLQAQTPDSVLAALRRRIDLGKSIVVKAGDFH